MALALHSRNAGEIAVVTCTGRIVEGSESAALSQHVTDVLSDSQAVVLHLGGVDFIDSSGLGLLVRILARAGQDNLKLCALSPRLAEVLTITKLSTVFDCRESEAEAIAAFYRPAAASGGPSAFRPPNVLCVDRSADLLTYVQELLRQVGLSVLTTDNLADAVVLLKAMTPKLVVVSGELRAAGSGGAFSRLIERLPVVELPPDFARRDAGETGQQLVDQVRATIAAV
jgi:anti-sigma B factor antagonist